MAITQQYKRSAKKILRAKTETTVGVFVEPDASLDAIPIEDFTQKLNPKTTPSSEVRGTLARGETVVGGFQPDLSGSALFRGAPDAATEPRAGRIFRASGHAGGSETVIPATGTTTATGGTTTTFTVDTAVDTDWPTDDGALLGRPILLSVNPVTPEIVFCVDYAVASGIATVTIHKAMGSALSNTTEAKALPCSGLYRPTSDEPESLSVVTEVDGKRRRLRGVRGNLKATWPGGEAIKLNLDLFGSYVSDDDDSSPVIPDFGALPPGAVWRDGLVYLGGLEIAATSFDVDSGNAKTRHPNPNVEPGFDIALITKRDYKGTLQVNDVDVATQDRVGRLADNWKGSFVAATQLTGPAGSRWAIVIPQFKKLDVGYADKEGVADDSIPYECEELRGDDEFILVCF